MGRLTATAYRLFGGSNLQTSASWPNVDGPDAGTGASMTLTYPVTAGSLKAYRVEVEIP